MRGDFAGAVSAAIIALPECIGYSLVAFAALGPDQASNAAAIGIYTAIFAGTAAATLRGSPTRITAPGIITVREPLFSGNDGLSLRSLHDLPITSLCGESKNPKTVSNPIISCHYAAGHLPHCFTLCKKG